MGNRVGIASLPNALGVFHLDPHGYFLPSGWGEMMRSDNGGDFRHPCGASLGRGNVIADFPWALIGRRGPPA
jgi:hypothetical protein